MKWHAWLAARAMARARDGRQAGNAGMSDRWVAHTGHGSGAQVVRRASAGLAQRCGYGCDRSSWGICRCREGPNFTKPGEYWKDDEKPRVGGDISCSVCTGGLNFNGLRVTGNYSLAARLVNM